MHDHDRRPAAAPPRRRALPALLLAAACLLAASAGAATFHVRVDDGEDRISLTLPVSLVQAAAAVLPIDLEVSGQLQIDDAEVEVEDLRNLWRAVRTSPEETLLTIDHHRGDRLVVAREDDLLVMRSEDGPSEVHLGVPLEVLDALFAGGGDRLDFAGALAALAARGDGPVLSVRDGADEVRIWIEAD